MTGITKWESPEQDRPQGPIVRLVDWAKEADAAYALAQKLTGTAFCPEAFRGNPADAAAAMLAGGELGLSPLAAMSAFDVIQGRASARAITLRAVVQGRGHEIVLKESTSTRCVMTGKRYGSDKWQTVTWTIDRAKDLKLTGKQNWQQQPQTMLMARATSELCRLVAADAILGLGGGYSSEEVADGSVAHAQETFDATVNTAPVGRRTMSRKPKAVTQGPEEEQQGEGEDPEQPTPDETVEAPSEKMRKAMYAGLRDIGLDDRDAILQYVGDVIGTPIESSKDLTKVQAQAVLAAIDTDRTPQDDDPGVGLPPQEDA